MSAYETLSKINVNEHTEKKNGLTYLAWAWAWGELLKQYPDSTYTIYENKDGWNYHTDGRTCWVKTGVTVEGKEYIEMLPVMDFKNRSIPLDQVTSFDVNKAIQRSLTKAVARHGLGLYIYAGEDLPDGETEAPPADAVEPPKDESRVAVVRALITAHGITNSEFNLMYGAYANSVWKMSVKPSLTSLSEEKFEEVITAINNKLNKRETA